MKYVLITFICITILMINSFKVSAYQEIPNSSLSTLKNYQQNTDTLLSSGLPTKQHFKVLKSMGVTTVIDLIPGDRSEESNLMSTMDVAYYNIQVDWENPTLKNFEEYVAIMQQNSASDGKTLTHCKLNWRGAVFIYLYRVTQLKQDDKVAKKDLLEIWEPNETWQKLIAKVKAKY
mgnify:CR=1 FL=1